MIVAGFEDVGGSKVFESFKVADDWREGAGSNRNILNEGRGISIGGIATPAPCLIPRAIFLLLF
jgi:hypothetical protein